MKSFKLYKLAAVLALVMLSVFMFAACSSKNASAPKSDVETGGEGIGSSELLLLPESENIKIVYVVHSTIETSDFPQTLKKLVEAMEAINTDTDKRSYEVNSDVERTSSGSTATYVLKIYSKKLEAFYSHFTELGTEVRRKVTAEDITIKYVDAASSVERLTMELNGLEAAIADLDPVADATTLIQYNKQISNIKAQLSNDQKVLSAYQERIDYSTVTLKIYSTGKAAAETGYDTKLGETFVGSLNFMLDVLKFLLLAVATLLPAAVLVGAGVFAGSKINKAYRKKHPKKQKSDNSYFYTRNTENPRYQPKPDDSSEQDKNKLL